ncbi:MAG: RdgB/HAM1 family non-canonical purine NTP pyrophosphatase [Cytophagaceae bacterium]|nr:RdgB/HAM1 family non-canonical purine NTP pyrophosphatase [Cytophagaceae bacterium]
MNAPSLCFATNNKGKLQEIRSLVQGFTIVSLQDINCLEELPETHETLEENSLEKASYVFNKFKISCFADDTGLEVEALGGEPGVYSARWAGPGCTPADNIQKLLSRLQGQSNRKARFRTVVTLILKGEIHAFEGIVNGTITEELRGEKGFGYDPVFIPDGETLTFAELSMEQKNKLSHRGIAVRKLVSFLQSES